MSKDVDQHLITRRRVAWLVAACYFMEGLDGTIVTTAGPKLREALNTSVSAIGAVMSLYLVTFAVVIPLGGWLATRIGTKRLMLSAIAIFTIASLGCAMSPNITILLLARIVQGIGAALMVPVGRLAVLRDAKKTDLIRLISYIVWPGLLAPALAPFVGGVLVTYASWQWLFLINVPLGVLALVVGLRIVPRDEPQTSAPASLDVLGMLLTSIGLGGLVYGAFQAGVLNASWAPAVLVSAVSLLVLALSSWHLLGRSDPYIDLRVLRITSLRHSLGAMAVFILPVSALPLLLPLEFQDDFRWSPVKSGLLVLAIFVGNIAAKLTTNPLIRKLGHRHMLLLASTGVTASLVIISYLKADISVVVIALVLFFSGAFRSIGFTGFMTLLFADVEESELGHANTLVATVQQVFSGLALAGAVIALRLGSLFSSLNLPTTLAYQDALLLLAACALVVVVMVLRFSPNVGASLSASRDN